MPTEDVNFERALQIAQGQEAAENDIAQLNPQLSSSDKVHKVYNTQGDRYRPFYKEENKRPPKVPPSSGNQQNSTCLSCGKLGHPQSNCKYRNSTCHKCERVGHIAETCMSKSTRVNAVDETTEYGQPADPFSMSLDTISAGQHEIEVPIELNNQSVLMELDTGAGFQLFLRRLTLSISRAYPLNLVPPSYMLTLVTPFTFLVSSMSMSDTSPSLQPFPSPLLLVLDPHFWGEIGSLKFVWIGTKSSVYMLLRV